jgi:hypothetical protein
VNGSPATILRGARYGPGCNGTRLYTHRNTLLRQLSRADQLLPRPLEQNSVNIAVALDVLHWRGLSSA